MPDYEYECAECGKKFDRHESVAKHDEHHAPLKCPYCGSRKTHQLILAVNVQTSKKS